MAGSYVVREPKYCEECGELFLRDTGSNLKHCAKPACTRARTLTIPTVNSDGRKQAWHMKRYSIAELIRFMEHGSKTVH